MTYVKSSIRSLIVPQLSKCNWVASLLAQEGVVRGSSLTNRAPPRRAGNPKLASGAWICATGRTGAKDDPSAFLIVCSGQTPLLMRSFVWVIVRLNGKCIFCVFLLKTTLTTVCFFLTDCPSFTGRKASPWPASLRGGCSFFLSLLLPVQLWGAYLNISAGSVEIWRVFGCTCVLLLYCWVWWKHLFTPFSLNSVFVFIDLTGVCSLFLILIFFFLLLPRQDQRWMDRNTRQSDEDSESEYDVVDNLEVRNLWVPARPLDQDNEYAGIFLIYTSSFLFFFYYFHLILKPWCNLTVTEAYFCYSLTFFYLTTKGKNIHACINSMFWTRP